VRLAPVRPPAQRQYRPAPQGLRIAEQLHAVAGCDGVEHDPLAQRPVAHGQLREARRIHQVLEHGHPRRQVVGAARLGARELAPLRGGQGVQAVAQRLQLGPPHRQLVDRLVDDAVAARRRHARQRDEGPRRADQLAGPQCQDLAF
jgi:hypothetical protein